MKKTVLVLFTLITTMTYAQEDFVQEPWRDGCQNSADSL